MAQATQYQLSLNGATWIDVNSQFTVNAMPDRLPNVLAVSNSIYNLLNSPLGSRSRIFQPEYGASLYQFIQEPLDQSTANKIRIGFIQALARWEPRITLDMANCYVNANFTTVGYDVGIAYVLNLNLQPASMAFSIPVTNT
jgi:phage baseplate assembly protein W